MLQLVLQIPEDSFGREVVIVVQNKLSTRWREAIHLGGPKSVVHQSGSRDVSPRIQLPRPLAREGEHSYLEPESEYDSDDANYIEARVEERSYETELTKEELVTRGEFQLEQGYLVLDLHLQKLKKPKESKEKKRKSDEAFAISPHRGPRPPPR